MKHFTKTFISMLLAVSMCLGFLPPVNMLAIGEDVIDGIQNLMMRSVVNESDSEEDNETYYEVEFVMPEDLGGEVLATQYVKEGGVPVLPNNPHKDEYEFKGWTPDVTAPVSADTIYTAVFEKVSVYTVTIKYVKADTSEKLFEPYVLSFYAGETISAEVDSPEVSNWITDKKDSVIVINKDTFNESSTVEIIVKYYPVEAPYTVEHYFETLDGGYELDESKTEYKGGYVGDNVTPEALLEIEGFHLASKSDPADLTSEGITFKVYYDRDVNTIVYDVRGGKAIEAISGKYGAEVVIPEGDRVGYIFKGWHTSPACSFEYEVTCTEENCPHNTLECNKLIENCVCGNALSAGDVITIPSAKTTTYYAGWARDEVEYTVVYMIEKPNLGYDVDPDNISLYDFNASDLTFTRKALVESKVEALAEDINYQGLTAYAVHKDENEYAKDVRIASYVASDSATLAADGSTLINVYFKRDHFTYVLDGYNSFKRYGDHGDWRDDQLGDEEPVHLYFKYNSIPEGITGTREGDYWSEIIIEKVHYGEDITDRWPDIMNGEFYIKRDGQFITLNSANIQVAVGATEGAFVFDGWRGILDEPINTDGRKGFKVTGRQLCNFNREGEELVNKWRGCLMVQLYPSRMLSIVEKIIIPADAPRNTTGAPFEASLDKYSQYGTISSYNQSALFVDWERASDHNLVNQGSFDPNEDYWLNIRGSGEKYLPHTYGWWVNKIAGFEYDWYKTEHTYGAYSGTAENPYNAHYVSVCLCSRSNCGYARSYDDARGLATDDKQVRLMPYLYNRLDYTLNFIPVLGDDSLAVSYEVPYEAALSWWEPIISEEQMYVTVDNITYTFSGWYYDEEYTKPVDWANDLMPAEGFSLYAKWIPQTIEITFDLNYEGAPEPETYEMYAGSFMKDQPDFSAEPVREGYKFLGWYTSKTVDSNNEFAVDQGIAVGYDKSTIYAAWQKLTTGYTVRYLLSGTNTVLLPTKVVNDKELGSSVTEDYVKISGLYPDKLSATIETLNDDSSKNVIIFYYSKQSSVEYKVVHHYEEEGIEVEIDEGYQSISAERVVEYSGHEDIPEGYFATVVVESLTLTSDKTNNVIHFYYVPYPFTKYIVHHYYQTDVDKQTTYTMYPEDEDAMKDSGALRQAYSYVAKRNIKENYKIEKIFVESAEQKATRDVYLTAKAADMNKEIHIYMYYSLINEIDIAGSKTWNDANDQDGFRPEFIMIRVWNGNTEVAFKEVSANDNWAWTFENLPKYENGQEITYTITEDAVDKYTTEINGYDVTNTHEPEEIEISGSKTWNDANNQDGFRPETITIRLLANGDEVAVAVVGEAEGWAWKFSELPKYEAGEEITYTITEDAVDKYTTEINGYDVTNTHEPEKTTIVGFKTWKDNNDQDGNRPDSIVVNLHANGELIDSQTVTAAEEWMWIFPDLDVYRNGEKIVYTLSENTISRYTPVINGYNITNLYTPEKTNVLGHKIWDDNDNLYGKRPEGITINLYANGAFVDSRYVTAADNWTWNFIDLDMYANGVKIVYTITEDPVEDYTSVVNGYDVINSYVSEKTSVAGSKTWVDNNDNAGIRPDSIVINLLANGVRVASQTVTAADNWTWNFADLEKYDNGKLIVYTITEEPVAGYSATVYGYDVVNTYVPETISIPVVKVWVDDEDFDGQRPDSITVRLYADGAMIATKVITAADNWGYVFTGLNEFNGNERIVYTLTEDYVENYDSIVVGSAENGFVITNEYTVEIEDEDVPLQSPETSDMNAIPFILMLMAMATCGFMFIKSKKR